MRFATWYVCLVEQGSNITSKIDLPRSKFDTLNSEKQPHALSSSLSFPKPPIIVCISQTWLLLNQQQARNSISFSLWLGRRLTSIYLHNCTDSILSSYNSSSINHPQLLLLFSVLNHYSQKQYNQSSGDLEHHNIYIIHPYSIMEILTNLTHLVHQERTMELKCSSIQPP